MPSAVCSSLSFFYPFAYRTFSRSNGYCKERFRVRGHIWLFKVKAENIPAYTWNCINFLKHEIKETYWFPFLQISRGQDPDVIVLGVTPGFALKLMHKFPFKGSAFLNPGSAGTVCCIYSLVVMLDSSPVVKFNCRAFRIIISPIVSR